MITTCKQCKQSLQSKHVVMLHSPKRMKHRRKVKEVSNAEALLISRCFFSDEEIRQFDVRHCKLYAHRFCWKLSKVTKLCKQSRRFHSLSWMTQSLQSKQRLSSLCVSHKDAKTFATPTMWHNDTPTQIEKNRIFLIYVLLFRETTENWLQRAETCTTGCFGLCVGLLKVQCFLLLPSEALEAKRKHWKQSTLLHSLMVASLHHAKGMHGFVPCLLRKQRSKQRRWTSLASFSKENEAQKDQPTQRKKWVSFTSWTKEVNTPTPNGGLHKSTSDTVLKPTLVN